MAPRGFIRMLRKQGVTWTLQRVTQKHTVLSPDDSGKAFGACGINTLGSGEKTAMSLRLGQATQ